MYNSKLFSILQHFDKYEQNRCRKYIQSPYFNRSEELLTLYEAFLRVINGGERNGGLDKPYLWSLLQPDKPYDDVRFRKYCSDLLKLVEGYLGQEIYDQEPVTQMGYLMQALRKRKIAALTKGLIKSSRKKVAGLPYESSDFYFKRYFLEKNIYDLTESDLKRGVRNNVEDISKNLDFFYFAEKLRYYSLTIMQKSFVEEDYKIHFIDEILDYIRKHDLSEIPPVAIYNQILLTLVEKDNDDHYYKLIEILRKFNQKFPPSESYNMYVYALNYCLSKVNKGHHEFLEEYFKLYNELLETEIIFIDGQLSPWTFKNIVQVALRLGYFKWAENFIKKYQINLSENYRDNAVTYNLAQVYFYQKRYDKVIELLREVEYEDLTYNLNSKSILIATYFETDEIEPLYSLFESFRTYLNRHRDIPEQRRKLYSNLIKYTRRLTKIIPGDKPAIDKLKKELRENKNVASLNWLKEKLAELED